MSKMQEITWHLSTSRGNIRTIVKYGIGVQEVFSTLSKHDRMEITLHCDKVTTRRNTVNETKIRP